MGYLSEHFHQKKTSLEVDRWPLAGTSWPSKCPGRGSRSLVPWSRFGWLQRPWTVYMPNTAHLKSEHRIWTQTNGISSEGGLSSSFHGWRIAWSSHASCPGRWSSAWGPHRVSHPEIGSSRIAEMNLANPIANSHLQIWDGILLVRCTTCSISGQIFWVCMRWTLFSA